MEIGHKRVGRLRQQIQTNLYDTLPADLTEGTAFEPDELYQNAGGKVHTILTSQTRPGSAPISGKARARTPPPVSAGPDQP